MAPRDRLLGIYARHPAAVPRPSPRNIRVPAATGPSAPPRVPAASTSTTTSRPSSSPCSSHGGPSSTNRSVAAAPATGSASFSLTEVDRSIADQRWPVADAATLAAGSLSSDGFNSKHSTSSPPTATASRARTTLLSFATTSASLGRKRSRSANVSSPYVVSSRATRSFELPRGDAGCAAMRSGGSSYAKRVRRAVAAIARGQACARGVRAAARRRSHMGCGRCTLSDAVLAQSHRVALGALVPLHRRPAHRNARALLNSQLCRRGHAR